MFTNLFRVKSSKKDSIDEDGHTKEFKSILSIANNILESNHPERIYKLIYSLSMEKKAFNINQCLMDNPVDPERYLDKLFIKEYVTKQKGIFGLSKVPTVSIARARSYFISPSDFTVITFPWSWKRMNDALLQIGEQVSNPWEHDPINHQVSLLYPLNVAIILNGNHSAAINILTEEANFKVTEVFNLEEVYTEVYTDGVNYIRKETGQVIGKSTDVKMAAIFEIGRRISESEKLNASKYINFSWD